MTKELILDLMGQGKGELVKTFSAVPEDKLRWKPLDNGRSALELFSEATNSFVMAKGFVDSRGKDAPSFEKFKELREGSAHWGKEDALAAMETYFQAYIAAFESVTEEDLAGSVTLPFGGGMTESFALWTLFPYRACVSRFAQINYIQVLYGDNESH